MDLGRCLMCMPVKWDTCWYMVHWTGLCKKTFKYDTFKIMVISKEREEETARRVGFWL